MRGMELQRPGNEKDLILITYRFMLIYFHCHETFKSEKSVLALDLLKKTFIRYFNYYLHHGLVHQMHQRELFGVLFGGLVRRLLIVLQLLQGRRLPSCIWIAIGMRFVPERKKNFAGKFHGKSIVKLRLFPVQIKPFTPIGKIARCRVWWIFEYAHGKLILGF